MKTALTTLEKMELATRLNDINDFDFLEVMLTAHKIRKADTNNRDNITLTSEDIIKAPLNAITEELRDILFEIRCNLITEVFEVDVYDTIITMSEDEYRNADYNYIREKIQTTRDNMTGGTEPKYATATTNYHKAFMEFNAVKDNLMFYRTIKNGVVELQIEHVELTRYYEFNDGSGEIIPDDTDNIRLYAQADY